MLIGAEGARLLENATEFPSWVGNFEEAFQSPAVKATKGDQGRMIGMRNHLIPTGTKLQGVPESPKKNLFLKKPAGGLFIILQQKANTWSGNQQASLIGP